jgi:hypothetical protein
MGYRIKELFAFIAVDADGDEGVLRRKEEIGTQPAIAQSRELLEALRPWAEEAATEHGLAISVARFMRVEES